MGKTCKGCLEFLSYDSYTPSKNIKDGYENKCRDCRREQRRRNAPTSKCIQCHKDFKSAKRQKYCSVECVGISRRRRALVLCSYCKEDVEITKYKVGKQEDYYCDMTCKAKHDSIRMRGKGNFNYDRIEYACDGCSAVFKMVPSRLVQKYSFCSYECYKGNIGKFYSGENNPQWNHSLTEEERIIGRNYPEYTEWRNKVFARDKYTCRKCEDDKGGNLEAHHILNYSEREDLRTDIDNGITLCKDCHKEFHIRYGFTGNNENQLEEYLNPKNPKANEAFLFCKEMATAR